MGIRGKKTVEGEKKSVEGLVVKLWTIPFLFRAVPAFPSVHRFRPQTIHSCGWSLSLGDLLSNILHAPPKFAVLPDHVLDPAAGGDGGGVIRAVEQQG